VHCAGVRIFTTKRTTIGITTRIWRATSKELRVPFLELKPGYDELRAELDTAYRRVMDSGWYVQGKELETFE